MVCTEMKIKFLDGFKVGGSFLAVKRVRFPFPYVPGAALGKTSEEAWFEEGGGSYNTCGTIERGWVFSGSFILARCFDGEPKKHWKVFDLASEAGICVAFSYFCEMDQRILVKALFPEIDGHGCRKEDEFYEVDGGELGKGVGSVNGAT